MASQSTTRSIIYLGMDVHKDSITIAVLPTGAKAPTRLERLPNALPKLKKWIDRVARDGDARACYEASGAGYVLHRALQAWGYGCEVIAPSLIPKRSGVQRKHDKRDATDLARLYRADAGVVRERREEGANVVGAEILGVSSAVRRHVPPNPVNVGALGADAVVAIANRAPNHFQQSKRFGRVGGGVQMRLRDERQHAPISSRFVTTPSPFLR